jgi:aerobic carbon-monoxide dehydrogenase medium subunit
VKSPVFKYHDPLVLEEVLDLLSEYGDSAKVLAGGQSLMPLLNFRLARPEHLVDVNSVAGLSEVSQVDGRLRLGAMVRQRTLERSATVAQACPLIAQAMPLVGHLQIRNRGTLGGSLAHADPAAELPAVMLALDAQFTLQSKSGQRVVAADEFFVGELTTALRPDEVLVHVELPIASDRTGSSIQEVAMRAGDFALAGVATSVTLGPDGHVVRARVVCFGVADRPLRIYDAESALEGRRPTEDALATAGELVSVRVETIEDIHASAAYRKRVSGILARRALQTALSTIPQGTAR